MKRKVLFGSIMMLYIFSFTACGSSNSTQSSGSNVESSVSDRVSDEETDDVTRTTQNLKMFLCYLGEETDGGNIDAPNEFHENVDKVFIMGRTGSASFAMTDVSTTQIRIMQWVDNETATRAEFDDFIGLLENYFSDDEGSVMSYDNLSDETYIWKDYDYSAYATCWYDTDTIKMNWYYDETVGHTANNENSTTGSSTTKSNEENKNDTSTVTEYEATLSYGTEKVAIAYSKADLEEYVSYMSKSDLDSVNSLIAEGKIAYVEKGTKVNIMEKKLTMSKVHILEGTYQGNDVWTLMEAVKEK